MAMDQVNKLARKKDLNDDTLILKAEIGSFLLAAGMQATTSDLLKIYRSGVEEVDGVEGVPFKTLFKWIEKQVNKRKPANNNALLMRHTVGASKSSSFTLPGASHQYGVPIKRDKEHGADVIFNWQSFQPPPQDAHKYVDIVRMNKNAARKGATTAKAFAAHNASNKQYSSTKVKSMKGTKLVVDKDATFGRTKAQQVPSVGDLLASKFNPANNELDPDYVRVSGSRLKKQADKIKRGKLRNFKQTKAQKLRQQYTSEKLKPKVQKKFQMRQFANVPSRLATSGASIIDNS